MAKIKPFKAFLYDTNEVTDLSKVVCPPYDVINSGLQEGCYNLSPYNIIRLILAKNDPSDTNNGNKYISVKNELDSWLNKGVLFQDRDEAVYFYEHEYIYLGQRKKRMGFISLLKIEDASRSSESRGAGIHAHEHTHLAPKEDRLQLLRQVRANLSPIFVLFSDDNHIVERLWGICSTAKPLVDIKVDSAAHKLWRISDKKVLEELKCSLEPSDLFIADGHHRYEVACNFREETRKSLGNPDKELPCDYVMTYFTPLGSDGLTLKSTHRIVKNIEKGIIFGLNSALSKYFDISEAKDSKDLFSMLGGAEKNEQSLGAYKDSKFYLLRLRRGLDINKIIDIDHPYEYKKLSVVILNQLILNKIFKFSKEDFAGRSLSYTDDADLAIKTVDEKNADMVFFLNPVKVSDMTSLALQGVRLPPKSTYFYPKLLSGLVINKFSEGMS